MANSEYTQMLMLHFIMISLRTEIHHNLENSTCDPLKYTMGSPIPIILYQYVLTNQPFGLVLFYTKMEESYTIEILAILLLKLLDLLLL